MIFNIRKLLQYNLLLLACCLGLFFVFGCSTLMKNSWFSKDVTKKPADIVDLAEVDPSIIQEMRYFGEHNFLGRKVNGYNAAKCMLTRKAAEALKTAQSEVRKHSLSLKVYDCYRPQKAVDDFVAWAKDLNDTLMKKEFYPKVNKSELFKDGYIAEKSGHSRGSTMDLTLVALPPAKQGKYKKGQKLVECYLSKKQRFKDNSIDMGTGYDCFDPLAHTDSPVVGNKQQKNRLLLKSVMEKNGFKNLAEEWWHYTLKDEPYSDTFFNFEVE